MESELRRRMLSGVGATTRDVEIAGVQTRLIEAGEGPPVVLQHGAIECGGIMWTPVVAQLARTHRIIAPDAPGLGESSPVDRLDVKAFTGWFDELLDVMDVERPALVAHSLLGSVAARYAAERSDRLGRLVIYGAPGVGRYRMPWKLRYAAIRSAIRPTPRNAERFDRFALLDLDASRELDPNWFDAFERYNLGQATRRHVKRTMNRLVADQTRPIAADVLDRVAVRTDLLWGRHDRMVPLAIGRSAAERHRWPLHVIENAAHAPHIESPSAFVETLEAILAA